MKEFEFTIKCGYSKYSYLDKEYNKFLINTISDLDDEHKERWDTYNIIIEDLLNEGEEKLFQEIKYRLTDGENPNDVMLDIINREENCSKLLWLLKKRIESYKDEDFYNQFY